MKKMAQYEHAYLINSDDHLPTDFPVEADFKRLICGLFLPPGRYGSFGRRVSCPARVLLLFPDLLAVALPPFARLPQVNMRLDEILAIEQRHAFPNARITIRTPYAVQEWPYNAHSAGAIGEFLFQLRQVLLKYEIEHLAARGIFGEPLDHKFGCAESDHLDSDERLIARFFSAPSFAIQRKWFLPAKVPIAGQYLAMTSRRALWLSDEMDGLFQPEGIISCYVPLMHIAEVNLRYREQDCEIALFLFDNISWHVPIQIDLCNEAESFVKRVQRLLVGYGTKKGV